MEQSLSAADVGAVMRANGGYGYGMPMPMMFPGMGGFGGGFGYGGDLLAILLLFALFGGGWGGGFGGFGGFGGAGLGLADGGLLGYAIGNNATKGDLSSGLTNVQNSSKLDSISAQIGAGFANNSTQLCNGFSDVQSAICNGVNTINTGLLTGFGNTNLANCQNTNAIISAIDNNRFAQQQCCCETKSNIADLKYTVATENCADRAALEMGVRDIITNQTANTQKILDTLCQDKIDAKNDLIAQLRQEILYARGQASQIEQTAQLRAGQNAEVDALYNRLSNCPIPSTPVYGRTPIFTCNGAWNNGCGCGSQFVQ
jgi:hypothetical protein